MWHQITILNIYGFYSVLQKIQFYCIQGLIFEILLLKIVLLDFKASEAVVFLATTRCNNFLPNCTTHWTELIIHIHHFVSSNHIPQADVNDEPAFTAVLFTKSTNLVSFLALAVDTDDAAVSSQPVKLPQHLHGLVAVLIRQIKQFRQQVQVLNGDWICDEEGLFIRPRHKHFLRTTFQKRKSAKVL